MPGPKSKHEHRRAEVEAMLRAGLKPKEIISQLGDIPRATVYDWAAKMGAHQPSSKPDEVPQSKTPDQVVDSRGRVIPLRPQDYSAADSSELAAIASPRTASELGKQIGSYNTFIDQLESLAPEQLPDFLLIKREMRRLISGSNNPLVQIQAGHLLSKLIQMRADIPLHILHEENQSDIRDAMDDVDDLSDEELAQQYKQMLG